MDSAHAATCLDGAHTAAWLPWTKEDGTTTSAMGLARVAPFSQVNWGPGPPPSKLEQFSQFS